MKKIIFWGDAVLAGPNGFAELLGNHIFLHHPRADLATFTYGGGQTTWAEAAKETPLHVIGKAPDQVILGLGGADLAAGHALAEILPRVLGTLNLILHKTQARICLLSVISNFSPEGAQREAGRDLNTHLKELAGERIKWIDLDGRVETFLEEHRKGPGEKHALHLDPTRLTPLGRLFLAHHAFEQIDWPVWEMAIPPF